MRTRTTIVAAVSAFALVLGSAGVAFGQPGGGGGGGDDVPTVPHRSQTEGHVSALPSPNRGAPYEVSGQVITNAVDNDDLTDANPAGVPEGITPLERDLWNTPNFYLDRELWSDPRYFHCNSNRQLSDIWNQNRIQGATLHEGGDPAELSRTARWGQCDRTVDPADIVTPYPFETAHDHYMALLDEAEERGGPTEPSYEWLLEIASGEFNRANANNGNQWQWGRIVQIPDYLQLLTPVGQTYLLQTNYYEAVQNSPQWSASFYYPEAYMRWYSQFTNTNPRILAHPDEIYMVAGIADNVERRIYTDGRLFRNLEGVDEDGNAAVPSLTNIARFYGESIGFWDGDMLVSWTSSLRGWYTHSQHEHSAEAQVIDIFTSAYDEGGCHIGFDVETIIYDPVILVEPVRIVQSLRRDDGCAGIGDTLSGTTRNQVPQGALRTIYNVGGSPTQVPAGNVIEFLVPDWGNRPWAQNWIYYYEQDMDLPEGIPGRTESFGDLF